MNAISPTASLQEAAEPTASDLGMLQRLVELAMQLAELAARQAHEEASPTPTEQAATEPPRPRRDNPHIIFLRLRRAIQETIAFRHRLAAGLMLMASRPRAPRPPRDSAPLPAPEPATLTPESQNDPRRPLILRYFRNSTDINRKKRKTPITQAHIEDRVTAELANDPQQKIPGPAILLKICKSLDIPFYATHIPPDLFRPPRRA